MSRNHTRSVRLFRRSLAAAAFLLSASAAWAQKLEPVEVEGQPLAGNVTRLLQALDLVGAPLAKDQMEALQIAAKERDAKKLQELLDPQVLLVVTVNPESRVKAARGPAQA